MHEEPAFVALGFRENARGGWWFRAPCNAYTLQIVPAAKERRGWCLGIARLGGMKWGKKAYPSPEAAVFQAFRVVGDIELADMLAEAMQARQDERMQDIQERIKRWGSARPSEGLEPQKEGDR